MSTDNKIKINRLLSQYTPNTVMLSSWLSDKGYNLDLQKRYRKSQWLESIGSGAMIRSGEKVGYEGALYALQQQASLCVHPGAKTALQLVGRAHFLELNQQKIQLFGAKDEQLPAWFKNHDWGVAVDYRRSSFLPKNIGLIPYKVSSFNILISGPVRALLECLYISPNKMSLTECYQLMEGLNNLVPKEVQNLLENCTSVKVKRLFLYFAEKAGHAWCKYIDQNRIDLGSGKRSIIKNGVYDPKYKITVPSNLENG